MTTLAPTTLAPTTTAPTLAPTTHPPGPVPVPSTIPPKSGWAAGRNLGPWKFTPQPNKWGYLNNPRWLATARKFVRHGPDDYDGRESEEPQVWNKLDPNTPYSRNSQGVHHQCGHWHINREGQSIIPSPAPYDDPCNPAYILGEGTLRLYETGGVNVFTLNEIGVYYDPAHTNLVPGTLITPPNSITNGDPQGWFFVQLPPAALDVDLWVFGHYINNGVETWEDYGPGGGLPNFHPKTEYESIMGIPLMNAYFYGYWRWRHQLCKDGSIYMPAIHIAAKYGVVGNPFMRDPVWAALGLTVRSIGLYYGDPGKYKQAPYYPVNGSYNSGSSWDVSIDPNMCPYADSPAIADRIWYYLGIQFNELTGIFYYPYGRCAWENPWDFAEFVGAIGGSDCFDAWFYGGAVDSQPTCGTAQVTFIADKISIGFGESVTLSWTLERAVSASIDQGIGPISIAPGSVVVSPTSTTTYTLTAIDQFGRSVAVPIIISLPLPIITFSGAPDTIALGGSSTLSWIVANATSASINHGIGAIALSGSIVVSPVVSTIYTLTAVGPGGTVAQPFTITVTGVGFAPAWAYFKLEEAVGDRVDATGNGHDGVPTVTGTGVVSSGAAKLGDGATFLKGTGHAYLAITGYPDLTSDAHFLYAGWAKVVSGGVGTYVLLVDGDVQIYLVKSGSDIKIQVYANNRYVEYTGVSFDALHFIVVYYNGTGVYLEVDNNPVASDAGSPGIIGSYGYLRAGQLDNYTGLVTLDEFGIWIGADADTAITNRTDLWNGGAGYSPY